MQLNPQLNTILLDLAAENLDLDNINQVIERIKDNIIPPQILAKEEGRPMPPPSPEQQMAQQAQQAAMMMPLLEAALKKKKAEQDDEKLKIEKEELTHRIQQDKTHDEIDREKLKAELIKASLEEQRARDEHQLRRSEVVVNHISTLHSLTNPKKTASK